jgi:hypothetical protein
MKTLYSAILAAFCLAGAPKVIAQDITFFFAAGDFSGKPDRFGNTYSVGPASAIDPRPFGNEALADVFFDEDDKWLIYEVAGNKMLVSHAPGGLEDAPEIAMDIKMAIGGKFEVILNFLDSSSVPGDAPIKAALGDGPFTEYSELNAIRATGGTSPGYPQIDGTTQGTMWWQSVSLGETQAEEGGTIKVRIDDVTGLFSDFWVTATFQGVTLRVIELGGAISEIQVSPGAFDLVTDLSGNKFKTGPADSSLTQAEWLTVNANSGTDNFWNIRQRLGSYGPILESFPASGEDAPPLQTSVTFAKGGTYDVFFSLGDTGAANPEENLATQTPLNFAIEGTPYTRWHANDGEFKGTPGYNDYEMSVGQITVKDGETKNFLIDDVQDGTAARSVYLGMRLVLRPQVVISEFPVSPGVFEPTTDLFGNTYHTWPVDRATYPTLADWITIGANSGSDSLWNIRQGLGPYGPIVESFPNGGDDAPTLQTSVTFAAAGTYDVFLNLGDTGAVDPEENLATPTPLNFGFEGATLTRWHANDGTFEGTPGYNNYEMAVGQVTVAAGETKNFIIDDVQDGTATRSVYLGMRFAVAKGAPTTGDGPTLSLAINAATKQVVLTWPSSSGAAYKVQASDNLTTWTTVAENVPSAGATTTYSEALPAGKPARFYRLGK